ncbi:hypothetical protein F908_02212 [Acinetobacter sp. NIPH 284]|uniref:hypothetical protein n=1 Tax=Acinetobacter sp. NIPH 284 TaxID=1217704 RepID=UPI0002D0100D|nr:hypothetical protein [Acinetobacter sp. NIPH 284]ENW80015.1 hypothetical protein F908_02212 [Acinetobacter sp. NIPH 284]
MKDKLNLTYYRTYLPIFLVFLSGCSPYIYKESINNLSAAITSIATTGDTASNSMLDLREAHLEEKISKNQEAIITTPKFCNIEYGQPIKTCTIGPKNPIQDKLFINQQKLYSDAEELLLKQKDILKLLNEYSLALNKITNAKDQDDLKQASNTLATSTANLINLKYNLEGNSEATANEAAYKASASILSSVSGLYLNHKRYKALKTAVQQVNPVLNALVTPIGNSLLNAKNAQLNFLTNRIEDTIYKLNSENKKITPNQYNTLLELLKRDVADVNILNMSNPTKTAKELISAHDSLNNSLKSSSWSNKGQFNAFTEQVKILVKDTEDLKNALK